MRGSVQRRWNAGYVDIEGHRIEGVEVEIAHQTHSRDTRKILSGGQQVCSMLPALLIGHSICRIHEGQHRRRLLTESHIQVLRGREAPDEEPCRHEQHQRDGHLSGDEKPTQTSRTAP